MATGSGKTTVMGMLTAWSILNKVVSAQRRAVLRCRPRVCPNLTIRGRLRELDPIEGDASIYRTRDLVPPHLMPQLRGGRVLVKNWNQFEVATKPTVNRAGVKDPAAGLSQQAGEAEGS